MIEDSQQHDMALEKGKSIVTDSGGYDPRIPLSANVSSCNTSSVQATANCHTHLQNGALRRETDGEGGPTGRTSLKRPKKPRVVWTRSLHNRFLRAIEQIGTQKVAPKKIHEIMDVPGLSRENVASHLQKYRIFLRNVADTLRTSRSVTDRTLRSKFLSDLPNDLLNNLQTEQLHDQISRFSDSHYIKGYQRNFLTNRATGGTGTRLTSQGPQTNLPYTKNLVSTRHDIHPSSASYNSFNHYSGIHINGIKKIGVRNHKHQNGGDILNLVSGNIPSGPENYYARSNYAYNSSAGIKIQEVSDQGGMSNIACNGNIASGGCKNLELSNKDKLNSNSNRAFSSYSGNQTQEKKLLPGVAHLQPCTSSFIDEYDLLEGTPGNTLTSGLIQNDSFSLLDRSGYMPQTERASQSNLTSGLPCVDNLVNRNNNGQQIITSTIPPFPSNHYVNTGSVGQGNRGTEGPLDDDLFSPNLQLQELDNVDLRNNHKEDYCYQNTNHQGCGGKTTSADWSGSIDTAAMDVSANHPKVLNRSRSNQVEDNNTWVDRILPELQCDGIVDGSNKNTVTIGEPYSIINAVPNQKRASGEIVNSSFYSKPQAEENSNGNNQPINEDIWNDEFIRSLLGMDTPDVNE